MYAILCMRLYLAFIVGLMSRFLSNRRLPHWYTVKRRYIKGTVKLYLCYLDDDLKLCGYLDVDWASYLDYRKSMTGYAFTLEGGAASWDS